MTLHKRIKELFRDNPGKKQIQLAQYLGISRASVSAWMNGGTKEISGKNAFGVARFFGNINPEWVQTGKGAKHLIQDYIDPKILKEPAPAGFFMPDLNKC